MRTEEFIKLLAEPYTVQDLEVDDLRELAAQYPYSQVIQLLYGLRLRYSSAHLFNQQLGRAAALSNDRSVLFELFESKSKRISQPTNLSVVEFEPKEEQVSEKQEEVRDSSTGSVDEAISIKLHQEELQEAITESESESEESHEDTEIETADLQVKEDTVVEDTASPQIDKPEPSRELGPESVDAAPEDLAELSPQDRVKAILARNKAIREQFEQERKGLGEKLFSKVESSTDEEDPSGESHIAESAEDKPIDIATLGQRRHEAQFGKKKSSEDSAEPLLSEADLADSEILEEEVMEDLSASDHREPSYSEKSEEEHSVEDMTLMEEVLESEKAPQTESEIIEEQALEEVPPTVDKEDKGDIALSARIRIIRDRLEALKESNALSEDELLALMEEHKRLESLMSDLPLDEEHVFDVELEAEQAEEEEAALEFEIDSLEDVQEEADLQEQVELHEDEEAGKGLDAEMERIERLAAELRNVAAEIDEAESLEPVSEDPVEIPSSPDETTSDLPSQETPEEELSFSDWLRKLREGEVNRQEDDGPREEIKAKVDLMDSFVDKLPDLKRKSRTGANEARPSVNNPSPGREESEGLGMVTETLAKVYIRQKHYKKAIQAYEILKLKYPEKSTFFASQILEIKKLAKSN